MVEEINNLVKMAKEAGIKSFTFRGKGVKISFSFARESEVVYRHEVNEEPKEEVVVEEAKVSDVDVKSEFIGILLWDKKLELSPGVQVKKDQVLGYIESLGVKHEIKSPVDGKIKEILPNESIVDYGKVVCKITLA